MIWCIAAAPAATVEITGLTADGAPVVVGVFQTAEGFPAVESATRTVQTTASTETITVDVGELGPGTWAVTVHHDQNANGELDFRWLPPGPSEGTSASCAAKPFALPSWDACWFVVESEQPSLYLTMWYY